MLRMARSKVWKYYDKIDHNTAQCLLCEKIIKTCGNTSNLMKHMKTHPQIDVNDNESIVVRGIFKREGDIKRKIRRVVVLPELQQHVEVPSRYLHIKPKQEFQHEEANVMELEEHSIEAEQTVENVTYGWAGGGDVGECDVGESVSSPNRTGNAEDIIEFEPNVVNDSAVYQDLPLADVEEEVISNYQLAQPSAPASPPTVPAHSHLPHLAYFVCKDRHNSDVILGEGFKHLFSILSPNCQLPRLEELDAFLAHQTVFQMNKLRQQLSGISSLSLSCAVHTTPKNESYLEVVAHYHMDRERQSRTLSVQSLSEHYNASQIVERLERVCQKFEIHKSKIVCCVTRSSRLLENAVASLLGGQRHVPCFGHIMESLFESIMNRMEMRLLCEKVRLYLETSSRRPQAVQWDENERSLSNFEIVERCLRALTEAEDRSPLSTAELKLGQQLVHIIKPIASSLREMGKGGTRSYPLASQALPMAYTLIQELKQCRSSESKITYDLRMYVVRQLEERFEGLEKNTHLALATLLDPRYRNMPFESGALVAKYMTELYELRQEEANEREPEPASEEYDIWSAYRNLCHEKQKQNSSHDTSDEIASYFFDPTSTLQTDPMQTWKNLAQLHPFLHSLAKRHLHIPATAVPPARTLQKVGEYEKFTGENLENILFMADVPLADWQL